MKLQKKNLPARSHFLFRRVVFILFIVGLFFVVYLNTTFSCREQYRLDSQVQFERLSEPIRVEVASSQAEQESGLSGRKCIPEGVGMLFDFDALKPQGIWMKGMNFPIDIVWFDENRKIVAFERGASPESYPKVFNGNGVASKYVLELGFGQIEQLGLRVGDTAQF